MTREQAIKLAKGLAEVIAPRALETEERRRLADDTVAAIVNSGLVEALVPKRWGGAGLGWNTLIETSAEIGKVCGSTAWCFSFFLGHAWLVGQFGAKVQEKVWGPGPRTLFGTSFAPGGKAVRVAGGYRLDGRWSWASGIDHCEWIAVSGIVPPKSPSDGPVMMLFTLPRSDYRIDDVWRAAGMRGTGSNDVVIEGAVVSPEFAIPFADTLQGAAIGAELNPGRFWRTPFVCGFPLLLLGPALGIARGAYQFFVDWMKVKAHAYTGASLADQTPLQIRIAESAAEIDAAALVVERALERMETADNVEEMRSIPFRSHNYRDYVLALQLLVRAVDRMFAVSGARSFVSANSMQRHWRDIHTVAAHVGLTADPVYEAFGRLELGLPPNPRNSMF
jgi:3-hydroxy-9,10-secoandrosta-1,3,5(10)-triene-9,17-dione monooxygenase